MHSWALVAECHPEEEKLGPAGRILHRGREAAPCWWNITQRRRGLPHPGSRTVRLGLQGVGSAWRKLGGREAGGKWGGGEGGRKQGTNNLLQPAAQ